MRSENYNQANWCTTNVLWLVGENETLSCYVDGSVTCCKAAKGAICRTC